MNTENYKQLGATITYQAILDFIKAKDSPRKQAAIIKQLKTPYMDLISGGLAPILAEKLQNNPQEICDRVKRFDREENLAHSKPTVGNTFYADLRMEQCEQM